MIPQDKYYDVGIELGSGANGTVYEWHSSVYPGAVMKIGHLEYIIKEADMMASIRHPGVARVYAVKRGEGQRDGYMIMERLGSSIHDLLEAAGHPSGR